jgi:hypothetical protein
LIEGEEYIVKDEDWVKVPLEHCHFLADPLTEDILVGCVASSTLTVI